MSSLLRFNISILLAMIAIMLASHALANGAQLQNTREVMRDMRAAFVNMDYPNCRFGVGGNPQAVNVTSLHIGWYMNWSTQLSPEQPGGAEYVQVVQLQPTLAGFSFTPQTATLYAVADQNPGAVWLIGNEPDSPVQNKMPPERYAQAYHQLYYLIKQRDPSARIGAGNIVQPTPLRMLYLDRMLYSYQQTYGEWLPTELWSIHSYILREIDPADPEAAPNGPYEVWGASIPPGITATRGILYSYSDMFNLSIFRQRLIDFRAWMRNRGYGDKPLYITEFGTLFPYIPYNVDENGPFNYVDEHGVEMDEARTTAFMTGTFNLLRQLTDANMGYTADANHVVQRWLWYSLSDTSFGGPLFDPDSHVRRPLGDVLAAYTQAISPEVDLLAVRLTADPLGTIDVNRLQTVTLRAQIANDGNISFTPPITVAFYSSYPLTDTLLASRVITSYLAGCGVTAEVSITWSNLMPGVYPIYIKVDGNASITEVNNLNNVATANVVIVPPRIYLPLVLRNYPWTP